jgi:hypothetical protein
MIRREFFFAAALAFGCSSPAHQTSSETHFQHCAVTSDCIASLGAGYECVDTACRRATDGGADSSTGGSPPIGSGDAGGTSQCDGGAEAALTDEFRNNPPAWVLVRLGFTTYEILGWQRGAAADGHPILNEADALSQAARDTGYGDASGFPADATTLSAPIPLDEWVFEKSPSDFGELAAVSVAAGSTVFGGGIVWAGKGDIVYPTTFRSPSELAVACSSTESLAVRSYDLGYLDAASNVDLSSNAVLTVSSTVLPAALFGAFGRAPRNAVVLLYPRTVGVSNSSPFSFDVTTAEWIVIVNP